MGTKEGKARVSGRIKVLAFDKGNDGWGEKKGSWMVRLSWVDKKSMSFGMYGSDYLYSTLSDLFSKVSEFVIGKQSPVNFNVNLLLL